MVTTDDGADSGPDSPDELLWNIKTVILKTGLSRASVYRHMKRGLFPPRRRIGPNRVAWVAARSSPGSRHVRACRVCEKALEIAFRTQGLSGPSRELL